jgi:outer membrane protein assembly factor BamB
VVAGAILLAVVLTVAYLVLSGRDGDVSNPGVGFDQSPSGSARPKGATQAVDWPVFAFAKARTGYLPLRRALRPPFGERWVLHGSTLLEFTPALGANSLFLLKNNGALYGVARKKGRVRWKRKLGSLAASAPAFAHGAVYATLLQRFRGANGGRVVAVSARTGRTLWSRKLGSRSESSPLIDRGTLYFGTENGSVYALRARDGWMRWRYRASGAVKGAIAMDGRGRLFFGDYSGHIQALRARDGKRLWRKGTNGTTLGLGSGNFYATPAVAYGRVYIGNTDGNVYSYATRDGALAWRHGTGNYVYSTAAVAQVPGGRPTVYVGSYDGTLYALDARSGAERWSHRAEGRVSGAVVVLGDLVFYSTLNHHTTAVGANTGKTVWTTARGAFAPVVSDGRGIFLNGYTNLYGIDGRPPHRARHRVKPRGRHSRAADKRRAAQRRMVHRRAELRRRGVPFCFTSHGRRRCRPPKPIVCFKHHGRTTCHVRRDTHRSRRR